MIKVGDKVRIRGGQDVWTALEVGEKSIKIASKYTAAWFFLSEVELIETERKLVKKTMYAPIMRNRDNSIFAAGSLHRESCHALARVLSLCDTIGYQEVEVYLYE